MSQPTTSRFADYVRGLFGLKGAERVNVLTDVMPVVNLQEESGHLALLRDEHWFAAAVTCGAGGAGTYSTCLIGGVAEGANNVILTDFFARKVTAGDLGWDFTTIGTGIPVWQVTDRRSLSAPRPTVATVTPGASTGVFPARVAASQDRVYMPPVVLPPNDGSGPTVLRICNMTANEQLQVIFFGYTVPVHGNEDLG